MLELLVILAELIRIIISETIKQFMLKLLNLLKRSDPPVHPPGVRATTLIRSPQWLPDQSRYSED